MRALFGLFGLYARLLAKSRVASIHTLEQAGSTYLIYTFVHFAPPAPVYSDIYASGNTAPNNGGVVRIDNAGSALVIGK